MRGIHSNKSEIRQEVFTEVAKMAFDGGDFSRMEELPYKLVPGEISNYYDNIFLARAKDPDREVKVVCAEGLAECKKMMLLAKAGKYNGYLLEGMACPGGCLGGAGAISTVQTASKALDKQKEESALKNCSETGYAAYLEMIAEDRKGNQIE